MKSLLVFIVSLLWAPIVSAAITASESGSAINIRNDRLVLAVSKSRGTIDQLSLDGQDLLGSGGRLYLDCHCDSGFWNGGSFQLYRGTDKSGTAYAGVRISANVDSGRTFESYYFLRDGETGLHTFGRAVYPNGGSLGEMRFLFRPSTSIWNHLSSSDEMWSVLPSSSGRTTVQDTTYHISGDGVNARYRSQMSDYFSKYMFAESWEYHTHHGMFSDGEGTRDGSTYGAWLVMNTKDTYYNGPKWSDLTVDGIVYNYISKLPVLIPSFSLVRPLIEISVSNHHGNGNPDTRNFDRTFGPVRPLREMHSITSRSTNELSNITTSTRAQGALPSTTSVEMRAASPIPVGTLTFTTPSHSMSLAIFQALAVALGRAASVFQRVSQSRSPCWLATDETFKTTTLTPSPGNTGARSAATARSPSLASRPARTV